jgi:hypothetical protein
VQTLGVYKVVQGYQSRELCYLSLFSGSILKGPYYKIKFIHYQFPNRMGSMASDETFTVYITQPLPHDSEASLLDELSQPNSQSTLSSHQSDQLNLSIEHALGTSVRDIANIHKSRDSTDLQNTPINKGLFIVADEGMLPSSYPHTVIIVNTSGMEEPSAITYQSFHVLASTTAIVLTSMASGKHGWEDFWQIAQANGGHFPGQ